MTVKMIKLNLFIQIKARTYGSCLIERKFGDGKGHSGRAILREGEVAEFVVGESLNSLRSLSEKLMRNSPDLWKYYELFGRG